MKKLMYWMLALTAVFAVACDDDDDNSSSLQQADRTFMTEAAMANRAEVELGQIAVVQGSSQDVKTHGAMMETDHRTALSELEKFALDENIPLPYEMNDERKTLREQLLAMTGHTFDSAYMSNQITAHQKTITLFEKQAASGNDARLKDYANKYLPSVMMHLHKADSIFSVIEQ